MKFDFQDINLIPQKSIVESRSECSTSLTFGGHEFKLPIIPANMECVINQDIAIKLAQNGYFYVLHRFDIDSLEFTKLMKSKNLISSISIGVNNDSYQLVEKMYQENCFPDFITIDIAHGHSIKMEKMLKFLKEKKVTSFIIAGNISSTEAVEDLQEWGADALKVGVGPGSPCTTYPTTGFGSRNCQAYFISECSKVAKIPIIADGGVKVPGDITKSLVLGATMVMVGGMLSGLKDSPGNIIEVNGKKYKEFWGSASAFQSGKTNRIEGIKHLVELKPNNFMEELIYLEECLQSSISYAGGKDLSIFETTKWI
jgi:GMP reductase